ncbi:hypothetical protein OG203_17910 [Nocardia sp. NBC_01499]|uniref:hypothetical protein n=1 Tax=Nocardia sp. NBC_01499 TaxID=2903597 RepID=UPI00386E5CD5
MFHKTATAAVTGLLAVAATLAVATGAATAAPTQPSPGSGSASAEQSKDPLGMVAPEGGKKAPKGGEGANEKGKGGKAGEEPTAADKEVVAALNSQLREFLRPPNGGAEMGPLGKTSDEWLDLFLGPQPKTDGTAPKGKAVG